MDRDARMRELVAFQLATSGPQTFHDVLAALSDRSNLHFKTDHKARRDSLSRAWKEFRATGEFESCVGGRRGRVMLRYLDSTGTGLREYQSTIPGRFGDEKIKVVKDKQVLEDYAESHYHCLCCGRHRHVELHHIVGGARRSDEPTNLLALCSDCHGTSRTTGGPPSLEFCMWLKWLREPETLVWRRVALLRARMFQELEVVPEAFDLYHYNHARKSYIGSWWNSRKGEPCRE